MTSAIAYLVELVGIGNGKGTVSFNKTMTTVAMLVFAVSVYLIIDRLRVVPPWYVWSFGFGALGAGFGLKGYLGAAARRTESFSQNDSTNTQVSADLTAIAKEVLARRDERAGIDPA